MHKIYYNKCQTLFEFLMYTHTTQDQIIKVFQFRIVIRRELVLFSMMVLKIGIVCKIM
jgi:hypothetical protein